jgi:hypothetical protein
METATNVIGWIIVGGLMSIQLIMSLGTIYLEWTDQAR